MWWLMWESGRREIGEREEWKELKDGKSDWDTAGEGRKNETGMSGERGKEDWNEEV